MTDLEQALDDLRKLRVAVLDIASGNGCAITDDRRRKTIAGIDAIERRIAPLVRPRGRLATLWASFVGRVDDLGSARGEQTADELDAAELLQNLRDRGWMVAVHNDYRLKGEFHTFWLFTDESYRAAKGEGRSDLEALQEATRKVDRLCADTSRVVPRKETAGQPAS